MTTKTIVYTPRIETRAWAARLRRKRAMRERPGRALLPPHLHDEERLVRGRLPLKLAPRPVDREVLIEPDARHVLLEDGERLAIVPEALVVLQGLAGPGHRVVEGGVGVLRPQALAVEEREDDAVGILARAGPPADREAAGLLRL